MVSTLPTEIHNMSKTIKERKQSQNVSGGFKMSNLFQTRKASDNYLSDGSRMINDDQIHKFLEKIALENTMKELGDISQPSQVNPEPKYNLTHDYFDADLMPPTPLDPYGQKQSSVRDDHSEP